jgi:hypothetical protein
MEIAFLRSPQWMAGNQCELGGQVWLEMSELGIVGWQRVESIEPCPPIQSGPGRVVTGTIAHSNGSVLRLYFDGTEETLSPTEVHRFYSVTRDAWVPAGKLRPGEILKTRGGELRIASIEHLPGMHRVFNLEVEADHRYFVGKNDLLCHNTYENAAGTAPKLLNQYNSVDSLIQDAGTLSKLKGGKLMGTVTGDGQAIFNAITQGGQTLPSGYVKLADGTIIGKHIATSTGEFTIDINVGGKIFKIRVNP